MIIDDFTLYLTCFLQWIGDYEAVEIGFYDIGIPYGNCKVVRALNHVPKDFEKLHQSILEV